MKRLAPLLTLLLLGTGVLGWWATGGLVREAERLVAAELGRQLSGPVSIDRYQWHLLPQPGLRLSGVQSAGQRWRAQRVDIHLPLASLLGNQPRISRIQFEQAELDLPLLKQLIEQTGGDAPCPDITARELSLRLTPEQRLGPYQLALSWQLDGSLERLQLEIPDQALLTLTPGGDGQLQLHLQARNWQLPLDGLAARFEQLDASGRLSRGQLQLDRIQASGYGGRINGHLKLRWLDNWQLSGEAQLHGVQADDLLALFDQYGITGRLNSRLRFDLRAHAAARLMQTARLSGSFDLQQGALLGADLQGAMQTGKGDGSTRFDQLRGQLQLAQGETWLRELSLRSSLLEAEGELHLRDGRVSGELEAGLRHTSALVGVPLRVSGPVDDPSIRMTRSAMVGAVAGTAALGPGVGTVAGIKAGSLLDKVQRFFDKSRQKQAPDTQDVIAQLDQLTNY